MTRRPEDAALAALLRRAAPPPPDPGAASRTAALLGTLPPPRPAGWRFLAVQAGFIRKGMWAAQFAVLACVLALALLDRPTARQYALWAAAAPLLLVANVQDLARVYHQGMLELELATRYSLPKVTAARLLIFGLCDAALLALLAATGAAATRTALGVVLLYCLTPFCAVSALCLALLGRLRPAAFARTALGTVAAALGVLLLPLDRVIRLLYAPEHRLFWAGALALSLLALAWQTRRLLRGGLPTTL